MKKLLVGAIWVLISKLSIGFAQNIPDHAQGLNEELIAVELSPGVIQSGVYSTKIGVRAPSKLAVLFPGNPSIIRPVVVNGSMIESRLTGNFLIRSRRFLANESIGLLLIDCRSDKIFTCSGPYQASKQRQEDVDKLISEVVARNSSIQEVWLVGTSMGTISSSFLPFHNPKGYAGSIHTAAITEPNYFFYSHKELDQFDYSKPTGTHFFIHHANDPCPTTTYSGAQSISLKARVPLVTVYGGKDFQGGSCQAFSQHGFRGKEEEVMTEVANIITNRNISRLEIK
jgi:hypothetical protein